MGIYKFYEKAPKIHGTLAEAKVDELYEEIDKLLTEAEFELDTFFDPDVVAISDKMEKIGKLVEKISTFEEPEYSLFEERYARLDNWLFDEICSWTSYDPDAPNGDEDVLGWM